MTKILVISGAQRDVPDGDRRLSIGEYSMCVEFLLEAVEGGVNVVVSILVRGASPIASAGNLIEAIATAVEDQEADENWRGGR